MKRISVYLGIVFIGIFLGACSQNTSVIWLDTLPIHSFTEGSHSMGIVGPAGKGSIHLGNEIFKRGVWVRYINTIPFYLQGHARKFIATVGVDNGATGEGAMKFYVVGDRKILFASPPMKAGDTPRNIDVNIKGIQRLGLLVINTKEGDGEVKSYWADARLVMSGNNVPLHIPNNGKRYILTPPPSKKPQINSAKIFGARPGNPFLYKIAASGEYPMTYAADHLPPGLSVDNLTGIISGSVSRKGTYWVTLEAKNALGVASQKLEIKIGDTICLTPPMGWNGWNSWVKTINREKVMNAAKAMVSTGLINYGWTYINIDDTWEGQRGGKYHAIQPNDKFPDFKQMVDSIHSLGLKVGLYSTPWLCTYQGYIGESSDFQDGDFPAYIQQNRSAYHYIGQYKFAENDARQWAAWGIDYLKYDWHMYYPAEAEDMKNALHNSGRDIVFSLSNTAPFEYAAEWAKTGNLYRTGSDINDTWLSLYTSAFETGKWRPYGGPGHWNDPDMMVLGKVSTGSLPLHQSRLTPDEQYSHVSIYCLLAAPLILGYPLEQSDSFTLNLLTNNKVLAIDQDPLGIPAKRVFNEHGVEGWVKPMSDGSFAVGLFYTDSFGKTPQSYFHWGDEKAKDFILDFAKIGLNGKWRVRDVWRQKDLGVIDRYLKTTIPFHGVKLIRVFPFKNPLSRL